MLVEIDKLTDDFIFCIFMSDFLPYNYSATVYNPFSEINECDIFLKKKLNQRSQNIKLMVQEFLTDANSKHLNSNSTETKIVIN